MSVTDSSSSRASLTTNSSSSSLSNGLQHEEVCHSSSDLEVINIQSDQDNTPKGHIEEEEGGNYSSDYEDDQDDIYSEEDDLDPDSLGNQSSGEEQERSLEDDRDLVALRSNPSCRSKQHQKIPVFRRLPSRASLDSQRSISYFVDLNDDEEELTSPQSDFNLMTQSAVFPSQNGRERVFPDVPLPAADTAAAVGVSSESLRMTQSLYGGDLDTGTASSRASSRQSQAVSFFVDFSGPSSAAGTPARQASSRSEQRPRASRSAGSQHRPVTRGCYSAGSKKKAASQDQTCAFFQKIKKHLETFNGPCFSKDEVRQRKKLAERIGQLLAEEEEKLGHGKALSDPKALDDLIVSDGSSSASNSRRPVSAYYNSDPGKGSSSSSMGARPMLRRERTFDLEPGTSVRDAQLVEITLDDSPVTPTEGIAKTLSKQQKELLVSFQQQRALQVRVLKQEVEKLEQIERELLLKANACGPEPVECWTEPKKKSRQPQLSPPVIKSAIAPVPTPRQRTLLPTPVGNSRLPVPQRPARRCDSFSGKPQEAGTLGSSKRTSLENLTTFATSRASKKEKFLLHMRDKVVLSSCLDRDNVMTSSTPCSWFIPNEGEQEEERAEVEEEPQQSKQVTGNALYRRFRDKQQAMRATGSSSKKVLAKPQAYFLSCDEEQTTGTPATAAEMKKTRNRDKKQVVQSANEPNLQEALERHRPDYIERTKHRENHRLAKKMVAADRAAIIENVSSDYCSSSSREVQPRKQRQATTETGKTKSRKPSTTQSVLPSKACPVPASRSAARKAAPEPAPALRSEPSPLTSRSNRSKSNEYTNHQRPSANHGRPNFSYESPYSQSRLSQAGVPRVILNNNPPKELKRKELGGYRTNRAMSPMTSRSAKVSITPQQQLGRVRVP